MVFIDLNVIYKTNFDDQLFSLVFIVGLFHKKIDIQYELVLHVFEFKWQKKWSDVFWEQITSKWALKESSSEVMS